MKEILKKLGAVQTELKAPKGQYNSFGKYKYRSCEDILEAVKPLLDAKGCTLIVSDAMENIGDRYYIKATATIFDRETGESVSNSAYAREEDTKKGMDGSQITGTASSYARKYALNGLFLIDDTKDADTDEYKNTQQNSQQNSQPTSEIISPICPVCGKPVKPVKRPDGTSGTPEEVMKGCGGMCYDCYKKQK